jgi:hypothetical protein
MTTGRTERLGRPPEPVSASRDGAGDDPLVISFDQLSPDSDALDRSGASRGWKLGLGLGVVVALGVGFVAGRVQRQEPDVDRRGPVSVRLWGADTGLDSAVLVATTPTDTNLDARMWLIGPSVEMGVLDGEASPYQQADQAMLIAETVVSLTEGQVGLRSVASDRAEVLSMSATSLVAVPTDPDTQLVGVVDDESLWMLDPTDPSTLTQRELPEGVVAIVGALDASTFVVETGTVGAVPRWARWGPRETLEPLDSRISDDDDVVAVAGGTVAVQRERVLHLLTIGTDQGVTIDLDANDLLDASRGCLSPLGRFMVIPGCRRTPRCSRCLPSR